MKVIVIPTDHDLLSNNLFTDKVNPFNVDSEEYINWLHGDDSSSQSFRLFNKNTNWGNINLRELSDALLGKISA